MSTKAPTGSATPFAFPEPPSHSSVEWPGEPIGLSNTITRTKSRTTVSDKTLDADPARRARLLARAAGVAEHDPATRSYDVVIHGVRVRAISNSPHLLDYWQTNWYSVAEWEELSGSRVAAQPQCTAYALVGVEDEPEAAYYSRATDTIVFFNTAYYGQLKSWVLGAVGRILAEEYGIHSIHGACVALDQRGILYIAPTGTGKSTSSYGLMQTPGARFHSDDWVYIRYMYPTKDGDLIAPTRIVTADGTEVRGYRCFQWLEQAGEQEATVEGLGPRQQRVTVPLAALLRDTPPAAYAYLSEKVFYLRSNLVETFPEAAYELLHSKLENVPTVHSQFTDEHRTLLQDLDQMLLSAGSSSSKAHFAAMGAEERQAMLARFFAFNNARAMLRIGNIFPPQQVYLNPLEPVRLTHVFLLKRDFNSDEVLKTLSLDTFIERLLLGLTPDGKSEIAYNAYRAVDDAQEKAYVSTLREEAARRGESLYAAFRQAEDVPATLYQEFELFRLLYQAAGCYDLNTTLRRDPTVRSQKDAVERTIALITKVVSRERGVFAATLGDYAALLSS